MCGSSAIRGAVTGGVCRGEADVSLQAGSAFPVLQELKAPLAVGVPVLGGAEVLDHQQAVGSVPVAEEATELGVFGARWQCRCGLQL